MAWFDRANPEKLFLSVLTLGEISKGARLLSRRDPVAGAALQYWLDGLKLFYADRLIPIDQEIAEVWAKLSAVRPVPVVDSLLAATGSVHGLTLATRNVRDFEALGVTIVNPWQT